MTNYPSFSLSRCSGFFNCCFGSKINMLDNPLKRPTLKGMHWLLQHNLSTDEQRQQFVDALDAIKPLGATWSFIKLIPFVGDVIPDDDYTGKKVFALGSTSLIAGAQKRGWSPGVIFNENFRYEAWRKNLGAYLLNFDCVISRFADAKVEEKSFMRPCEDLKAFTGQTITSDELISWQKRVAEGEISTRALQLSSDTPVIVAPIKNILREWRFFVVNKQVITGSQYRTMYGKAVSADVDLDVYSYAQDVVSAWQPADCYALDIGETNEGLGVIEINCFNGSGIYACDMAKAFAAVEKFYDPK